ncbi:hypothetical protein E2C01_016506 [Portunus trituberculatus]|uniref:Uncharacterized protein n=1 Tax=Portunus trituberculatus TaxID=210409 RepID=A0A5B7DQP8_PORTR|nr:hypothetical protein [Portunus trituberculatus]
MQDCEAWARVEDVLERLSAAEGDGALLVVRDDTLLLKLHSHLHTFLLHAKEGGQDWGQRVTLLRFVQTVLDPLVVANASNSASVALGLRVLATLVTVETDFNSLEDSKALSLFMVSLPSVRSEPSLASPALSLAMSLMAHPDGLLWLVKNGIWEKMLLPCLRSPSIFVQREGVNAMVTFILNLRDTQHFEGLVKDLYLLSDKFNELRSHMGNGAEAEEIRQTNLRVLSVFKQLYWQTLGKSGIYTKVRDIDDINIRILAILQYKVSDSTVSSCTDLLILNLLHKFYEKLINYGILEQFLLDSLCADIITLSRMLLERGYTESFVRSSANVHKYWDVMMKRMKEESKIDLTSVEALLHIVTAFQVKVSALKAMNSCINGFIPPVMSMLVNSGNLEHNSVEQMGQLYSKPPHLANLILAKFTFGSRVATNLAVPWRPHGKPLGSPNAVRVPFSHFVGATLCSASVGTNSVDLPPTWPLPAQQVVLVGGTDNGGGGKDESGRGKRVLAVYLADVKWEVRDSALEVLITCMKLAKEKYPHFVNWLGRHHLNSAVITAIGDVEGYVRASAFTVLANIISIDKEWWSPKCSNLPAKKNGSLNKRLKNEQCPNNRRAWSELELEEENLPHRALSAVLGEGEAAARKAALTLVQELFLAGKFSEEEVDSLVVRAVQHCAEDPDNEVRLAALEFIHAHLLWSLSKNAFVMYLMVTRRVCECGYLCVLLASRRDLVASVASRAREVFCFLSNLVTRYQITQEDDGGGGERSKVGAGTGKDSGQQNSSSRPSSKEPVKEETVLGHLDQIDKTIQEILNSSTLENVSTFLFPIWFHSFPLLSCILSSDSHPGAKTIPKTHSTGIREHFEMCKTYHCNC